ncbi:headcase protein isoform X2 [Coccinella septempunctata]|uniref:headcase protein isoform X2 n=1 Tax=Coccinella septempunctata TaxID=41139 RepID=UPI001D09893B|nr:headcase protein isoform X2 [Coccinella septempunctata]
MNQRNSNSRDYNKQNVNDSGFTSTLTKSEKKRRKRLQNKENEELVQSCRAITEILTKTNSKTENSAVLTEITNGAVGEIRNQSHESLTDDSNVISIPSCSENEIQKPAEQKSTTNTTRRFWYYDPAPPPFPNYPSRPNSAMSSRTQLMRALGAIIAGGANGIFTRRLDFSSFNSLPKLKLNSYQIKTEDEGNHGNDDTRCFILSTLASHNRSKVQCVLCEEYLLVFDRYPLVDGTFFLSPRQHAKFCIEVKVEGRTQFLTCVCMGCLEGVAGRQVFCRFCSTQWVGSTLVLGTMYSYDIFAAMPCCTERIKCNSCFKPVLHPAQRLNYFSDYSHMVPCPHCRTLDTHFVKSLPYCFVQRPQRSYSQWP